MIRWKYFVTRLALLAILTIASSLFWDPSLKWSIVKFAKAACGSRIDIGKLDSQLMNTNLDIKELAVADPKRADKNLLQASSVHFDLDTSQLLRRRFLINQGELLGLRFGTPRNLDSVDETLDPASTETPWEDRIRGIGDQWFENATTVFRADLEEDLESPRLGRELIERYPREYKRLAAQADELRERIQQIKQLALQSQQDPRQAAALVEQIMKESQQVRGDIRTASDQYQRLDQQLRADKRAIAQAKDADKAALKEKLRWENWDADKLSEYLLGPEMGKYAGTAFRWIEWGRSIYSTNGGSGGPSRGTNVKLPGIGDVPQFLIENLKLDGATNVDGQAVQFTGLARGITSQPELYGRPTEIQLSTRGTAQISATAQLDYSQAVPKERILVNGPRLQQPQRRIGRDDGLSVTVPASPAHLWMLMDFAGEDLSGELVWKQTDVSLQPRLDERFGGQYLNDILQSSLSELKAVEAALELSGTMENPRWHVRSNLGSQLTERFNGVVRQEIHRRGQAVLATADRDLTNQIAKLDGLVAKEQQQLNQLLNELGGSNLLKSFMGGRTPRLGNLLDGSRGKLNQLLKRN